MKNRFDIRGLIKRTTIFLSTFGFAFSIVASIAASSSLTSKNDYDCLIADIKENNKNNVSHKSFWTVRPIEARKNWLGGDIKPWLYSMTSAWSAFETSNYNFGFIFNPDSNGQTLIKDINNNYIQCGILATPTPSAIKAFDLAYTSFDGKSISFNGKTGFYISESLYKKTKLDKTVLRVFDDKITEITFDGVVRPSSNIIFSSLSLADFIVVPSKNAWDMETYTGQSTYACVMGDDYFQDLFYTTKIFFMNKFLDKKNAYLSTFVDDVKDLPIKYENIESHLQSKYSSLVENGGYSLSNKNILFVLLSIVFSSLLSAGLLLTKKISIRQFLSDLPIAILISLIFYWVLGLSLFNLNVFSGFWTLETQIKTLIFGLIFFAISIGIMLFLKHKKQENYYYRQHYYEIDL